jgi:m7GpppX diphosphatase
MIHETPELYTAVTRPYIEAFPPSRIQWHVPSSIDRDIGLLVQCFRVHNILNHITEADQILYEDTSPTTGFLLLPDLKWDRKTLSSLYLVAIAHSSSIKSLRDLRKQHIPMLQSIKREASRTAHEKWGIGEGSLRFFIHYQPSYCENSASKLTSRIKRSLMDACLRSIPCPYCVG